MTQNVLGSDVTQTRSLFYFFTFNVNKNVNIQFKFIGKHILHAIQRKNCSNTEKWFFDFDMKPFFFFCSTLNQQLQ